MKRLLRSVLNFLERKFPDRIEVTVREYQDLHTELGQLNASYQLMSAEALKTSQRIKQLEDNLRELNANFGITGIRPRSPLER